MGSRAHRVLAAVGLALGGAYLLAGPGTGCAGYVAESGLTAADFCFIFDCQNGMLGGALDPCATGNPLFVDCPDTGTGP